MKCFSPIILKRNRPDMAGFFTNSVPCGVCIACKKRKAGEWIFRLTKELECSYSACFVTLTYNDDNLVYAGDYATLVHRDIDLYLKRLRKAINGSKASGLKYYLVGEYGPNTHRPHYHAIMFNVPSRITKLVWSDRRKIQYPLTMQSIWQKGHVHVGEVTPASIAYCAGYTQQVKNGFTFDGDPRLPEKQWMSKGIGIGFLTPAMRAYLKAQKEPFLIVEGGRRIAMPRYYKDKVFDEADKRVINRKIIKYYDSLPAPDHKKEWEYKRNQIIQQRRKLKEKRPAF